MLAEQRFADALSLLEPVLQKHKDDPAVRKLYDHIQAERKIHAQRVRLEREQNMLRKLVSEEKFGEALAKGEVLVKEFPDEIELARMVDYARSQQAILDHQRRLKEKSNEVLKWLDKFEYPKAIKAAEQALEQFPGNLELKQMLDEARAKQQEKEHKEYVEKQIRSIKAAINRGEQTEAIDLARQTLAVVKHDTQVGDLLKMAERDRELRDQKKSQDDSLKTVAMLLKSEKFDEASEAIKNAEKTQIFNRLDPRVQELLTAAKEKRAPAGDVSSKEMPQGTIAAQYVYAPPGKPAPAEPVGAQGSTPSMEMSGTVAMPPSAVPMPPPPAPAMPPKVEPPPPEIKKPEAKPPAKPPVVEEPKKKAKPAVEEPPKKEPPKKAAPVVEAPDAGATAILEKPKEKEKIEQPPAVQPAASLTAILEKPKEKEKEKKREEAAAASTTSIFEKPKVKPPVVEERPAVRAEAAVAERVAPAVLEEAPKKSPALLYGGIAAGVVLLAVVGWFVMKGGGPAGPSAEQRAVYDNAQQLFTQGDKTAALAKYKEYVAFGVSGDEKTGAEAKIAEIEKGFADEQAAWDAALAAQKSKDWNTAEAKYREVMAIGGKRKAEAETALETVAALKRGEDPTTIERNKFTQANNELRRGNYPRAQSLFQEVVAMGLSNKAASEAQLKVIESRLTEERVFKEGLDLKAGGQNDPAVAKFEEVVRMNGPKKGEAQTQIDVIRNAAAAAAALQKLNSDAQAAISQKNYRQARSLIQQIQGLGGDANALTSSLNNAEKQEFDALQNRFNQLKSADDDTGLRGLQRDVQAMADGGGSQADSARNLVGQIPAAITAISDKKAAAARASAAAKETEDKRKFDEAMAALDSAKSDSNALRGRVTNLFRAIADSNSNYAAQAREQLTRIPTMISAAATRPCPSSFPKPTEDRTFIQTPKSGAVVAPDLLDAQLAWVGPCKWPSASGTAPARMLVTVDENGDVVAVKALVAPADAAYFAAAEQAVRTWKASPGPTSKKIPVKVEVNVNFTP